VTVAAADTMAVAVMMASAMGVVGVVAVAEAAMR
jgi:hypothetical protein